MLPFIIAAAASILSNQQKKRQEANQLYLDQLTQNARELGGNTRMADLYRGEAQIGAQGADYGGALGLVGKLGGGGGSDSGDVDVTPNDQTFGEGSDLDALLKGWKQDDPNNDDDFALLGVRRR